MGGGGAWSSPEVVAPDSLREWSSFTAADPTVRAFDAARGMKPVPNQKQLEALGAYYAWRREQAKKP
jgi:para-nitrobenzyl esterase